MLAKQRYKIDKYIRTLGRHQNRKVKSFFKGDFYGGSSILESINSITLQFNVNYIKTLTSLIIKKLHCYRLFFLAFLTN